MKERGIGAAQTRWIVISIYASCLVMLPITAQLVRVKTALPSETLRLLPISLLVVAIFEYGLSLYLERRALAGGLFHGRSDSRPAAAAIVTASIGGGIAVYGFALAILGAPGWSPVFYLLSLVHGLHLAMRWPDYEQVAEREMLPED